MELKELWRVVRKRLAMIITITLVATIVSGVVSKIILPKQYAGTATLMVIPHNNSATSLLNSLVTGQQLVDTYAQLVTSPSVVSSAESQLNMHEPLQQFTTTITATPKTNTDLLTVTVKGKSPTQTAQQANAVAAQTVSLVTKVQGQNNLRIVNKATPSTIPVGPKSKTNVAIAFVLGLLVSGGLAFLFEYLDDSIHSEEDVKRYFADWPLLTIIPEIEGGGTGSPSQPRPQNARQAAAAQPGTPRRRRSVERRTERS